MTYQEKMEKYKQALTNASTNPGLIEESQDQPRAKKGGSMQIQTGGDAVYSDIDGPKECDFLRVSQPYTRNQVVKEAWASTNTANHGRAIRVTQEQIANAEGGAGILSN